MSIVCRLPCDVCSRSTPLIFCQMLYSISRQILLDDPLSTIYLVFQYEHAHNSPIDSKSSGFILMIVKTRCRGFVQLVNGSVRQFAVAFYTFLIVTLHLVAPCNNIFRFALVNVYIRMKVISFVNKVLFSHTILVWT